MTWLVTTGLGVLGEEPPPLVSGLRGGLAGLAGLATYLLLARAMRVREVTEVVNTVLGRLRRG